jgi:hypothetical protein
MNTWSLPQLLTGLPQEIERKLAIARASFAHPGTKGDASERVWLELLQTYLPSRYQAETAHVVDSNGEFSDQIDIVIFDRQYSPFIFNYEGQKIIPIESVYAVFESKQTINATIVGYAQDKVASIRRLHRTSLPIPHAGGVYAPKPLPYIFGGLLAFESDWTPALSLPLTTALKSEPLHRLDLGCVAAHGTFACDAAGCYALTSQPKAATAFLFDLISLLQTSGTVPMIDVAAYKSWLG